MRYCLVAVDFLPAAVIRASMLRLCAEFAAGAQPCTHSLQRLRELLLVAEIVACPQL